MTAPDPDDPVGEWSLLRALLLAWSLDRAGLSIRLLGLALLERDLDAAMTLLGLEHMQNALAAMQGPLDQARQFGWEQALATLPAVLRRTIALQLSLAAVQLDDPAVWRLAQQLDLSRITAIGDETRQALRDLIAQGWRDGTHPDLLARQLRDAIGPNRPQIAALIKYRQRLMAQGRDIDQIERMVARKVQQYRNLRARTIARTELARSTQEGARQQYKRLVQDGIIQSDEWVVSFRTREDERVCNICGPIDGQYVPIGGLFVTAVGMVPGPPLHVSCRCGTRLIPATKPGPLPARSASNRGGAV